MDLRRLPELFCGFQRERGRGPTLYPVACSPQAWAARHAVHAAAGRARPGIRPGRERDPACAIRSLPPFLDEVTLRNLRLKQASVDLKVQRHGTEVSVEILRNQGQVQVSVVFP